MRYYPLGVPVKEYHNENYQGDQSESNQYDQYHYQ